MANYILPFFGQINLNSLEGYYGTKSETDAGELSLDINFASGSTDENAANEIKAFLENIDQFNKANRYSIEKNFEEKGEAVEYINFYFEELGEDQLAGIIDSKNERISKEKQLLDQLRLKRIGLYPDGKSGTSYFAVFDYTIYIDGEPFDYLLVVKTDKNGRLDHITWES